MKIKLKIDLIEMNFYKTFFLLILILVFPFNNNILAQNFPAKDRILKPNHTIKSKIMEKDYQLYFSFPSGYSSKDTISYPVLYVLDGKYMFSIIDGTRVILDFENKIEDVIIVCIGSGQDLGSWQTNRTYEFTPSEDINIKKYKSGGAEKFLECLKTEIIPFVDKHYKTNSDNGILGHSLGGLFCTYTFLKAPDSFKRYGISSPSLSWNNYKQLNQAKKVLNKDKDWNIPFTRIFISVGENEETEMVSIFSNFITLLKENNNKNLELSWNKFENETHLSVVSAMISRALSNLYGKN